MGNLFVMLTLCVVCRFRTYEVSLKEITDLVDNWERSTGCVRPPTPVEGQGEGQDDPAHAHPPSGRKGKKGADKAKEDKKSQAQKEKEVRV